MSTGDVTFQGYHFPPPHPSYTNITPLDDGKTNPRGNHNSSRHLRHSAPATPSEKVDVEKAEGFNSTIVGSWGKNKVSIAAQRLVFPPLFGYFQHFLLAEQLELTSPADRGPSHASLCLTGLNAGSVARGERCVSTVTNRGSQHVLTDSAHFLPAPFLLKITLESSCIAHCSHGPTRFRWGHGVSFEMNVLVLTGSDWGPVHYCISTVTIAGSRSEGNQFMRKYV